MFEKEKRYSFKKGLPKKVISTPYFTLRFGKAQTQIGKVGVVVSKKVSKKAVTRNEIKRKVLNLLKENLGSKSDEFDIVLYIRPQIAGVLEDQLKSEIVNAIERI